MISVVATADLRSDPWLIPFRGFLFVHRDRDGTYVLLRMLMMFEKRAALAWGTKHFSRRCSRARVSQGFKWGLCLERTGLRSHSGVDIALDSESKGRGFESHCDQSLCSPFFFSFRIYFRYFLTSGFTESVVFFMDFWLNEWRIFWGNAANADPKRLVLEFACSLSSVLSHGKCFGVSFFSIPVHLSSFIALARVDQ